MPISVNPINYGPGAARPGANLNLTPNSAPGARPGVVSGGAQPGMREEFSYDAQGNRIRRMVPITPPGQPAGGAQPPVSGGGGTGPVSSPPAPAGGGTNPATGGAGGPANPPIDPVDVQVGQPTLNSFQQYQDAAMQQARRQLDPIWEGRQRRFEQDMINRGLAPGSEAYQTALANFDRSRNDQYDAAQRGALQTGLAAQQQAFGQSHAESQLAMQRLLGQLQADTSLNIAGLNANTSLANADINRQNFLDQLAFNREGAATAADQWNRQFGQNQQQWMDQFGAAQNAQDFGQMMQMMGFDRDTAWGNNTQDNQRFGQLMSLFGALQPQGGSGGAVDYLSALGMNQNQQNQNYQAGMQQSAQNNQNWLALAGLLLCDENAKTVTGDVDPARCLEIVEQMPLAQYTYNGDPVQTQYIGTMAQPFNRLLHGAPAPLIRIMDLLGVLVGAVKALTDRVQALEAR